MKFQLQKHDLFKNEREKKKDGMKKQTKQNKTTLLLIINTCNTSKGDNIVFVYNVVYCKSYAYMYLASIKLFYFSLLPSPSLRAIY